MVNAIQNIDPQRLETLGPAERIVHALTSYTEHLQHNRPGIVYPDARTTIGSRWAYALWKQEGGQKIAYERNPPVKVKKGQARPDPLKKIGVLGPDGQIRNERNQVLGRFQDPGLYPEAVAWIYNQIAEIWKMDNEFSAHLASWAWAKEHRDLKCILAAFMLVQSRSGEPVIENGKVSFHDDDFRAVGEAMVLLRGKDDINPKMLLRIGDILKIPAVAEINRQLGFGKSARTPAMGRYPAAVTKWLRSKEHNPKLLEGLVKAGFKETVKALVRTCGYKPESPLFFQALRWKQKQSKDGRRHVAIGLEVKKAESWEGLTEADICRRIVRGKMSYKRVVALIPSALGLTRAIMAAVIETGTLSDADLIILTPTLEDLGLLTVPDIKVRWEKATQNAENQRATNIAKRVKSVAVVEKLQEASDKATAKALEEATKNLRVYVVVDKSGSMQGSLVAAKEYLKKFLGGFPLDRLHISVFNTIGKEITLKAGTAAAVEQAFKGEMAGGGTSYVEGFRALIRKDGSSKPKADEDALVIFVGDEGDYNATGLAQIVRESGFNPVAFGLLKVPGEDQQIVQKAARELKIPCFRIEESLFNDPYTVTRTLRNLIASTPVGKAAVGAAPAKARKSLIQEILETPLLRKPAYV